MKIRGIQWISFVIGVTILQIYSGISMMSSGHYLEITGIVISTICLGISGWLSLKSFAGEFVPESGLMDVTFERLEE